LTLVELLVVIGLLSAFSYMSFRLLSGGLSVWKLGEESRDQDERAQAVLDLVRRDLAQADASALSRFEVEVKDDATRMRLVRTLGASEEARLHAGLALAPGAAKAPARPSMGLLEVAYAWTRDPAAGDPAVGVVRRAVAPLEADRDPRSLFTKDAFAAGGAFDSRAADIVGGVLRLAFEMPGPVGDVDEWDSGNLRPDATAEPRIPRRVRVSLHLEREERDRRVVRLAAPIDAAATRFDLDDPRLYAIAAGDPVKIDGEWMIAASSEPRALLVARRGALGTAAASHEIGAALHRGRAFSLEVPIDCHRESSASRPAASAAGEAYR